MGELVESSRDGHVSLLRLNRPEARNALSPEVMEEIAGELERLDPDPEVRCIVIAGSEKVFAAGADIRAMSERSFAEALYHPAAGFWKRLAMVKTPMIAAVSGWALGGGCELALACDMIVASETAVFGQPEINLGTIPGAGGTQRLARAVGKSKAMELVLTGRNMGAEEAERCGLVARVVPAAQLLDEAVKLGETIATKSRPVVAMAKDAVNAAYETALAEGLKVERRLFYATFATEDRREGMSAFVEKRPAQFRQR